MLINFLKIKLFFIFTYLSFTYAYSNICYFVPPQNWQCVHPKYLSKEITIAFIGKKTKFFRPSINFISEIINVSEAEYIEAAINLHKNDKNIIFRNLGKIKTNIPSNTFLFDISSKKYASIVKTITLQSISIYNNQAFILTSTFLKSEFLKSKNELLKPFKSLKITKNLLSEISDPSKKKDLENFINQLKEKKKTLEDLEKYLSKNYTALGFYWKILLLKEIYAEIQKK